MVHWSFETVRQALTWQENEAAQQLQRLLHSPVHRLAHFHLESYAGGSITDLDTR